MKQFPICGICLWGASLLCAVAPLDVYGDTIYVEPLFEYPTAPEEMENLSDRSNFLMVDFWSPMDLAHEGAVDQNALNDAFGVYASAMVYADRKEALASISKLIKSLDNKPVKLLQFCKAAEESLYGPRATMWCDEAYVKFLEAITSNPSVPESRKLRYASQLEKLRNSAEGKKFGKMRLTLPNGRHKEFQPATPLTIVEFGNPECDDCNFAKLKLDMATDLKEAISNKEMEIAFIVADAMPQDEPELLPLLASNDDTWISGISYGADDIYDIRRTPCFYVLGPKGVILGKNLNVTDAVDMARRELAKEAGKKGGKNGKKVKADRAGKAGKAGKTGKAGN